MSEEYVEASESGYYVAGTRVSLPTRVVAMVRFQADADFNQIIVAALLQASGDTACR